MGRTLAGVTDERLIGVELIGRTWLLYSKALCILLVEMQECATYPWARKQILSSHLAPDTPFKAPSL
jgi:hypothetical protein